MNVTTTKNQKIYLKTTVPGPESTRQRSLEDEHLASGLQGYALSAGIVAASATGSSITDVDGNTFLDFIGGIGVNALGHSHPKMAKALAEQSTLISVGSLTSGPRVELLHRLSAHAPDSGRLHRTQLYSSGTEAVESALRLAKSYTKKHEFVSYWGAFHGKSMGPLALMGGGFKHSLGPMVPGAHLIPYADCYRCPLNTSYPGCGLACVELGRKQLKNASCGSIAAFIVEPMQGTAGNIVPPDDFLPAAAQVAKENEALLIVDEMLTGFGRTGAYWGHEHSGVTPDILTIGKAFGGGFPLTAVMTSDVISKSKPWSNPSGSSSSHGGNPLGARAGATSLAIIDDERLVENARIVGDFFLDELKEFEENYPFVGTVRGRGLFLGMELVSDKKSKNPLSKEITQRIFLECVRRGLLTMSYSPHFRIQPALTIDIDTVKNGVAVLREVFDDAKSKTWWKRA